MIPIERSDEISAYFSRDINDIGALIIDVN